MSTVHNKQIQMKIKLNDDFKIDIFFYVRNHVYFLYFFFNI